MAPVAKPSALDNVDQSGRNALWWAAQTGQRDAVAALLARGSLPLADQDAVGPLHVAAQGNHREIVEQLVPLTDTNARSKTGNSPLLSAAHSGAADALTALIESGADLEAPNDRGDTALIAAVRSGDIRSTQLLLAAGANPNVRNQRFESASSLIKQRNEPEWLELLESKWLRFGIGYRLIDGPGYASTTNACAVLPYSSARRSSSMKIASASCSRATRSRVTSPRMRSQIAASGAAAKIG